MAGAAKKAHAVSREIGACLSTWLWAEMGGGQEGEDTREKRQKHIDSAGQSEAGWPEGRKTTGRSEVPMLRRPPGGLSLTIALRCVAPYHLLAEWRLCFLEGWGWRCKCGTQDEPLRAQRPCWAISPSTILRIRPVSLYKRCASTTEWILKQFEIISLPAFENCEMYCFLSVLLFCLVWEFSWASRIDSSNEESGCGLILITLALLITCYQVPLISTHIFLPSHCFILYNINLKIENSVWGKWV